MKNVSLHLYIEDVEKVEPRCAPPTGDLVITQEEIFTVRSSN
ncbi:BZIP domain-containing protein [Psidium guajava]|nr:BZIP domain-containing protein [Psidium guajava]